MNQMQPVALRRAPSASVVVDRSARCCRAAPSAMWSRARGSVVVQVSAGDTVTVRDIEGCQPCELVFASTDGRVDPRGLGVPSVSAPRASGAARGGARERPQRTRSAFARRPSILPAGRPCGCSARGSPAGASARFTVERDGLSSCRAGRCHGCRAAGHGDRYRVADHAAGRPKRGRCIRLPEPLADPLAGFPHQGSHRFGLSSSRPANISR